jgi:hypothetical protein
MALVPAVNRSTTDEAFFVLLTIMPADGQGTIFVVNNLEPITSRGQVFEAYPFAISLPQDTGESQPSVTISIDAVDQRIIEIMRALQEPPTVKIEVVMLSTLDVVDKTIDFLELTNVQYNALTVTGTLRPVNFLSMPAIDAIYSGVEFPDLVWR